MKKQTNSMQQVPADVMLKTDFQDNSKPQMLAFAVAVASTCITVSELMQIWTPIRYLHVGSFQSCIAVVGVLLAV